MNEANVLRWIEALESGEYRQARGALRRGDGFCCLGVACELMGLEHSTLSTDDGAFPAYLSKADNTLHTDTPPAAEFSEWLGITHGEDNIFVVTDFDGEKLVSEVNDDGYGFEYIAELLRDHFGLPRVTE